MDSEILDLRERDRLAARGRRRFLLLFGGRRVALRVGPERAQLDTARRGGAVRVDDDGEEGLVVLLLDRLLCFGEFFFFFENVWILESGE